MSKEDDKFSKRRMGGLAMLGRKEDSVAGIATKKSVKAKSNFEDVAAELKKVLQPYVSRCHVSEGTSMGYALMMKNASYKGKPLFFAAARAGKAYASFHLMPLYVFPELVDRVSPELRRRMQGKACFNFSVPPDATLKADLKKITKAGFDKFSKLTSEGLKQLLKRS